VIALVAYIVVVLEHGHRDQDFGKNENFPKVIVLTAIYS
jgi:hypothetical protein